MKERKRGQKKRKKENGANAAYKWEVQREKLLMLYGIPLGSRLGFFFPHQRLFCILIISFSSKQFRPPCLFPSEWGLKKKTKGSGPVIFPTVDFFLLLFLLLVCSSS